ncbi:MAG: hypothetical protein KGJ13_12440 [Patescibacteria group bacterium]|nr:hypothetical protein [Patescibacteria group bacterium]
MSNYFHKGIDETVKLFYILITSPARRRKQETWVKIRYLLLAIVFGVVGWTARGMLAVPSDLEQEVMVNDATCAKSAPAGYAGYSVTRAGELRGCLNALIDESDWTKAKIKFTRIEVK